MRPEIGDQCANRRAAGLLLAKQGFITLSIDLLGDGERIDPGQRSNDTRQFYKQRYPDPMADTAWSIIGKSIWDVMRSVDYLKHVSITDRLRITSANVLDMDPPSSPCYSLRWPDSPQPSHPSPTSSSSCPTTWATATMLASAKE